MKINNTETAKKVYATLLATSIIGRSLQDFYKETNEPILLSDLFTALDKLGMTTDKITTALQIFERRGAAVTKESITPTEELDQYLTKVDMILTDVEGTNGEN